MNIVSSVVLVLYDFIARGNCMTLRVTGKCFEIFLFFISHWLDKKIIIKCRKAQSGHKGHQLTVSTIP